MESTTSRPALEPADRRNLPRSILLAMDAALHIKNLPRRLRATLAEIGRHVSQHAATTGTVWPSKETIAENLGASPRTIYRHLADLEELKLIVRRPPPPRTRWARDRKYFNGHIALTDRGAQLLGLTAEKCSTAHDKTAVPYKKKTGPCSTNNHPGAKASTTVPEDLAILAEQEVEEPGIFRLMKEASAKGQRLGDIVAVKAERLRDMRGGGLVQYLRKLIAGPTNWRRKAAEVQQKAQAARRRNRAELYAHRRYSAGPGIVVRICDGFAEIWRENRYDQTVAACDMGQVFDAIERGRLVEIRM